MEQPAHLQEEPVGTERSPETPLHGSASLSKATGNDQRPQRGVVTAWGEPHCGCEVLTKIKQRPRKRPRHDTRGARRGCAAERKPPASGIPARGDPPSFPLTDAARATAAPAADMCQQQSETTLCALRGYAWGLQRLGGGIPERGREFPHTARGRERASLRGGGDGQGRSRSAATVDQTSVGPGSRVGSGRGDPCHSLGDGVGGGA